MVQAKKPIIGLAGGIGSGKSTVAGMLRGLGGFVIDADAIAHEVLQLPEVRSKIVERWGAGVLGGDGGIDRRELGRRVFVDPKEKELLESWVHPLVRAESERRVAAAKVDPSVRFIVRDVPLLFEVGLDRSCDKTLFVDAPVEARLARVKASRGWDRAELERREKSQWPLDKKRAAADAIIRNDGDEAQCLARVRSELDRIL